MGWFWHYLGGYIQVMSKLVLNLHQYLRTFSCIIHKRYIDTSRQCSTLLLLACASSSQPAYIAYTVYREITVNQYVYLRYVQSCIAVGLLTHSELANSIGYNTHCNNHTICLWVVNEMVQSSQMPIWVVGMSRHYTKADCFL